MRHVLLASLLLLTTAALAAEEDPFRIIKLEQDVRNLERQVQNLSREVSELRLQLGRPSGRPAAPRPSGGAVPEAAAWLEIANWDRLRAGMSELQVIDVLGPPTAMRQEGELRVLLYALEIGSSGFLTGSVSLRDRTVVEVRKPELK